MVQIWWRQTERATAEEDEVEDDEEAVDGCDDAGDENLLLVTELPYRRLGCLAHSLQLVIKEVYNGPYSVIIAKTRWLVGRIRNLSGNGKGNFKTWQGRHLWQFNALEQHVHGCAKIAKGHIISGQWHGDIVCCWQCWRNNCRPT